MLPFYIGGKTCIETNHLSKIQLFGSNNHTYSCCNNFIVRVIALYIGIVISIGNCTIRYKLVNSFEAVNYNFALLGNTSFLLPQKAGKGSTVTSYQCRLKKFSWWWNKKRIYLCMNKLVFYLKYKCINLVHLLA